MGIAHVDIRSSHAARSVGKGDAEFPVIALRPRPHIDMKHVTAQPFDFP